MKLPRLSNIQSISEKVEPGTKFKDTGRWRDLTAYWILGLCNNYGYVVMLSAAHDIIARFNSDDHATSKPDYQKPENERYCQIMSTGAILLADILPSLVVKACSPFLPFYVNVRIFLACFMQCAGFLLVAYADSTAMAISGVVLTSLSSGLGEASFLSYSSKFHKNVISTWSSGTGGAGIFGSFSYAALISIGISPVNTMLLMLSVPLMEGAAFWVLLRNPCTIPKRDSEAEFRTSPDDQEAAVETKQAKLTLSEKIRYVPSLFKYMIPLSLVYLFEYFINQGLFELVYFKNIENWLDQPAQYRWLQVDYQIGVFISRSSVNVVKIDKIWLMAVFQLINVGIFLTEVITFFTPSIWIVFGIVFWEGLLGGGAYVNTFYRMSKEIPEDKRNFALGVVPVADAIGIALAGVFAMPVHNELCRLPMPSRG
ncbi:battenin [Sitodiplosis mosellana]|uniref:battenin n=1 Tax=Sitodiplosis mosellana TaxID=263140 RepID=UPI0024444FF7|nr:battenin [Sitodiplosis mosellana]XP_055297134.1 battenin [Sitodiplosis mosellana]XP_055297135.1 battenin [Sitodiplosis mosellana]XP_055297136.1 battenin [Sitodiplosis mosellana]XP_055297137.1 battenin [Sitodiplosis mosellana]XP_055297138.1 battenin [Sitodiplosis mosellana]